MRIIISPAKKMREDTESIGWTALPACLEHTERILESLRAMSPEALQKLWKCNDDLAALNIERLRHMELRKNLTPAILAYEGIQYQYMAPGVFTNEEFAFVQKHLRILSGFYGLLRPFDGVQPYRLEMQAKLSVEGKKDLYAFWGERFAGELMGESDWILNLASKEYSLAVSRHLPKDYPMITCIFGEEQGGKIIEKGTMCKMARGEMVRYLAEKQIDTPEAVKDFDRLYYRFSPGHSNERNFVFLLNK